MSALFIAIEQLEILLDLAREKINGVKGTYQDRADLLHYLAETIRNDMEVADEIVNGIYSLKAARTMKRGANCAGNVS